MNSFIAKTRVLLINPSRTIGIYKKAKVIVPEAPNLTLATIAAPLLKAGHTVDILDLAIKTEPEKHLRQKIKDFRPDFVGITFATPTFHEAASISKIIKEINPKITLIGGGPHASVLPEESLRESEFDTVVIGEGDNILFEVSHGKALKDVPGLAYKTNGSIQRSGPRNYVEDLDNLEFPSWQLYDLKKYRSSRSLTRKRSIGFIETSRGCPYGCIYCNKGIFGNRVRVKSPKRVISEMKYLLSLGFEEIHPQDDAFTVDLNRAKEICRLIIAEKLKFPWVLGNGVRIDAVDEEFLRLAFRSGCYKVQYGIESASQDILKGIDKRLDLGKVEKVVNLSHSIGLEVATFFIFGLPGETEKSMKDGIDLAVKLDTLYSKASILIPFPGTPVWKDWEPKGYIKSRDWSIYSFHNDMFELYDHPDIEMRLIYRYYQLFYRKFYLRISYIIKRLKHAVAFRHLFSDMCYFINQFWS